MGTEKRVKGLRLVGVILVCVGLFPVHITRASAGEGAVNDLAASPSDVLLTVTNAVWDVNTMTLTVEGVASPTLDPLTINVTDAYTGQPIGSTGLLPDGIWQIKARDPSQIPSDIVAQVDGNPVTVAAASVINGAALSSTAYRVFAWNDLGMHCYDPDFTLFSILPLFNVLHAQIVKPGTRPTLLSSTGLSVTYRGLADSTGSINTTSTGKTNFWDYTSPLFGVRPAVNQGLPVGGVSQSMPGAVNAAQPFHAYDSTMHWFSALGVPITSLDDKLRTNPFPLMNVAVSGPAGTGSLATVVPVSNEMTCNVCHLTGKTAASSQLASQLKVTFSANPKTLLQYKENVLILHRARRGKPAPSTQPLLCASCHVDPVMQGLGYALGADPKLPRLSMAMHTRHASAVPQANDSTQTCYNCHPGPQTQCMRGVMEQSGIGCVDCHGNMTAVGNASRTPWVSLPKCQSCHTGDYVSNVGGAVQGRLTYTGSAGNPSFISAPNSRFAENSGKLYRNSLGHSSIACEACHGSPHAIWPARTLNDNMAAMSLQGHKGMIVECSVCHGSDQQATLGGPHGMHPAGSQIWVNDHHDFVEKSRQQCQACHGLQGQGTVLSKAAVNRAFTTEEHGKISMAQGTRIGCGVCHENPLTGGGD
jgi:hypothetical protein